MYKVEGILSNYGYCIEKKKYDKKIIKSLKEYFTVMPIKNVDEKETIEKFKVYYENDGNLVLPKFMCNKTIDIIVTKIDDKEITEIKLECIKSTYEPKSIDIKFTKKLMEHQEKIITTIMKKFNDLKGNEPIGGILQIYCGGGKTVLAIYLASMLKLKTLIIVHQDFLMEQWKTRFMEFTDATIGMIKQDKFETDNDITIGMIQTIFSRDYDSSLFKDYGLVIYDEIHHLGSKCYSKILMKTSAKYTIGLSATPERNDGMTDMISWFSGNIIYKMTRDYICKVLIKRVLYNSKDKNFKEYLKAYNGKQVPNHIKMETNIINISSRNNIIIKTINYLKEKGRKIIIVSKRVEHLELLKNKIDEIIKENEEEHIYCTSFYMGKTKRLERRHAENNADIIFATLQLVEEGLDIKRLDTIIFAMPFKLEKTLIQAVGRILRINKVEDMVNVPLVIDICDELSLFKLWTKERERIYNKEKYYIENYTWLDNKIYNTENIDCYELMLNNIDNEEFINKNLKINENDLKEEHVIVKDKKNIEYSIDDIFN